MISGIGIIPMMSVGKTIDVLSNMYVNTINNKVKFSTMPSVMLWGAPGLGKSQSIREMAEIITAKTGKRVNIVDVRLILFNPVDLRGIPTSNPEKTMAIWLKPKIFDMDPSDDIVNILFLDEISSAAPSVQAAAYQITLDRTIGEHKLPDNCIVIAAGNRMSDKSVAYPMPKALANRLLHLEVCAKFESWNEWAIKNNIHPIVLGFLKFKPDYLDLFERDSDNLAFATPRSWQMVSQILTNVSDDFKVVDSLIAGLVGGGVCVALEGWAKVFKKLPDIEKIFAGKETKVPKEPDIIYALTSSMITYAKKYKDDIEKITNSIRYASQLPPDFSLIILKDYQYIEEGYINKLLRIPEYKKWLDEKGRLLNGSR